MFLSKIIIIGMIYAIFFCLEYNDRRKYIKKDVALITEIEPSKKAGRKVLRWYTEILEDNEKGKKDSYLTDNEIKKIKNFLWNSGIKQMPAPIFKKREGEFASIMRKSFKTLLGVIKTIVLTFFILKYGYSYLLLEPSSAGLFKGTLFVIFVPIFLWIAGKVITIAIDE